MQAPLDDLTEAEVLDRAAACARTARQSEVELLVIAHHWAVMHSVDRLDPERTRLPGREKGRRYGGEGVAEVSEFAAAELGARIGLTTWVAARLIGDAQDLHHRHPVLWARVQALEVRASYARHVVTKTRELSQAEAAHVDAEVAESADGRIPWTRFEALVAGKVAAAAPAVAREKEERARKARFAKVVGRPEHGMASFLIRADVATIAGIDEAVARRARALEQVLPDEPGTVREGDETRADERTVTIDDRRVLAALQLATGADPDSSPEVAVSLVVHLDGRQITAGPELDEHGQPLEPIARLEGHGPVTRSWVRETLGPHARFTIRPVLDLAQQSPVDAYEIPARHRRAVRLLSPADTFPYGSCTSDTMQIDHTDPHARGGSSRLGNYGPLSISHHRLKTHGTWQVRQPLPGIHLWQDPHGATYLVDHTGTRPLGRHGPDDLAPTRRQPTSAFEIYRPDVRIVLDPAA